MTLTSGPSVMVVSLSGDLVLAGFLVTPHAEAERRRPGIGVDLVRRVLPWPEQRLEVRPGRVVFQSRRSLGEPPKVYLVRVIMDLDRSPPEVVTVYRTSRIARYWRSES